MQFVDLDTAKRALAEYLNTTTSRIIGGGLVMRGRGWVRAFSAFPGGANGVVSHHDINATEIR